MAEYTEDELYDMSDDELEAAFKAAKAEMGSPEGGEEFDNDDIENEVEDEEEVGEPEDGMETYETEEGEEQEEVEDLEQPEVDSDDDASLEGEEDGDSEEESEEDEVEPDGADDGSDEDEPTDDDAEAETEEQPAQVHKFKANGREYEFTDREIAEQFPKVFGQAMDYTKKMQQIKPWRKTIDAIESAELNHDDVNLMIDVLKGDKGAIQEVIKRTGVDTLELDDEENKYTPKDYGRDETTLQLKDVVDQISADEEYAITHKVISKDWDDRSWEVMSKDPEMIRLLHVDVKNGMYDKVQPIAEKLKVYDSGKQSDLDYYKQAAGIYFDQEAQQANQAKAAEMKKLEAEKLAAEKQKLEKVKQQEVKRKQTKSVAGKRKAAAPTKSKAGTKSNINYLDDSDEAFEEWYSKLQDM